MMSKTLRFAVLGLSVALPGILGTLAVLTFSGLELIGRTPSSPGSVRNIAEATASGAAPEVVRLLAAGQDPNRVWPVRREIISSTMTQVSAFEAAVVSRRPLMLELLHRQGARVDAQSQRHLQCLAGDLGAQEILDSLSPDRTPDCQYGAAIEQVIERARK
jgi:hypothetical protein